MSPRQRAVRDEPVPLDAHVLRGLTGPAGLSRAELAAAARANHEVYGFWGVSVWVAAATGDVDPLLRGRLARFEHVATYRVADLDAAGLVVLPTGAAPHGDVVIVTTAGTAAGAPGDLEVLLDRMLSAPHTESDNPYVDREGEGR